MPHQTATADPTPGKDNGVQPARHDLLFYAASTQRNPNPSIHPFVGRVAGCRKGHHHEASLDCPPLLVRRVTRCAGPHSLATGNLVGKF